MYKMRNGQLVEMDEHERAEHLRQQRELALRERSRSLSMAEVLAMLIPTVINTITVDDNTALRMQGYYPEWKPGMSCNVGDKVRHGGRLWRCLQAHTAQVGWEPERVASLWTEVCESHDGSEDDPIPYSGNMALVAGLYYVEDLRVYRCIRDTGIPVYNALRELVGLYVEEAI